MSSNPDETSDQAKPPLAGATVAAGFPSPAADYVEGSLDLNELLVKRPAATFFVRCAGESMTGAGIFPGDLLVVDRSLEPADGSIVVAAVDGEFTVKRLRRRNGSAWLVPENPAFKPLRVDTLDDCRIWGVVSSSIRSHRPG
jgi:DNA polymerase V